ncbi:outer membrane beta-barrel protein [Fluviicola taffensis]|uniref:Uncharacterized protein n=1 Tax=Fluviicola taffensis (strain DSM 16823 / NCIMB 13979 / RW262) TaxID=755732 RepID=F2II79_FLUTR|nr:outer membrane beta-barrel protein [Fluviicola taffensis]AEA43788.1 hypothetical protein Fluta_1799 [Fluviicola taffensis DSM 16823]
MKKNENKRLDQLLKDQLSEGTTPVPDFVWDKIEEELFPKKKRRGFFWWFFSGLCILIMGGLFGIAFSGQKAHSQNTVLSKNSASESLNTSVLSTKYPIRNMKFTTINPAKTKGCSQYREHATETTKHSDFGPNPVRKKHDTNTHQKTSKSFSKKHSKSKMTLSISSKDLLSKKTDPRPSSIKQNQKDLNNLNVPITDQNTTTHSTPENQEVEAKTESTLKSDSIINKSLSYSEILALIKRDSPENPNELKEEKRNSFFSLGIYGGPSLYSTATFKDYFSSGQLSNRTFASSGFELGLQARFKIGNRFRVYAGLAFNQKQTQFTYNLAITEADYFTYIANGKKIPLANIQDEGPNLCFLAKDVLVRYNIQSAFISLGTQFEVLKIGRFSAAADLRFSCNIYSSLTLKETKVLDIQQPNSENFSYFQPGAGLSLNYQLNQRISLGLSPFFSKQFYLKESFSRKMDELVIPVTVSFQF